MPPAQQWEGQSPEYILSVLSAALEMLCRASRMGSPGVTLRSEPRPRLKKVLKSLMKHLEIPSVAKATLNKKPIAAGLKSRPFKTAIFSATSKARNGLWGLIRGVETPRYSGKAAVVACLDEHERV
jgi:hypothetical protein